jgi:CheY-like chemotaxis protein
MQPRILVVDDLEDGLQMLGALLRQLGCRVLLCSDSDQCMHAASNFLPHVVLLDLAMPNHDGFEIATKLLNSDLPKFELIALSGYCDAETRERCERAGFHRFLAKPVGLEELQSLVSDMFDRSMAAS